MSATCDPPLPREGEAASRFAVASLLPRVDFRARCAAASPPERRSHELSGGGCKPVPEPTPASPRLIAGLSNSASAGPIGCTSGRCAFDFGVLDFGTLDPGDLPDRFEGSGVFAMPAIWDESGPHERAHSHGYADAGDHADVDERAAAFRRQSRQRQSPPR